MNSSFEKSTNTAEYFSLKGKNILVTGASSGIGRQTAISCSQQGACVLITGRNSSRLQETFDILEPHKDHLQVTADLTNKEDIKKLIDKTNFHIDGVVHCVGQQKHVPIRQLSEEVMTQMFTVNFLAPVMLTQQLLEKKLINQQGSIIFLLSTAAHMGTRGIAPYSAMKSGLLGIIKCLALEQAKRKIRVNGISPSAVDTTMWDQEQLNAQKTRHPFGLGTPEDIANASIYLLSDASRWVTGTTLVMDGAAF